MYEINIFTIFTCKTDILRKFSMNIVSSLEYDLLGYHKDPKIVKLHQIS